MAKYKCPLCQSGFAHTSGAIPNPNEYLVISCAQMDSMPENVAVDHIYEQSHHFFKCIECDAIAIFWNGFNETPSWYKHLE